MESMLTDQIGMIDLVTKDLSRKLFSNFSPPVNLLIHSIIKITLAYSL